MKPREWMFGAGIAVLTAAAVWGSIRNSVDTHEKRIAILEEFKSITERQLGGIDAKIDMLLKANDIEPPKRR